mgnify:CR=1 FL=1
MEKPLGLTMGDPAGIGGELTLAAWLARRATGPVFVALDDPDHLAALATRLGLDVSIRTVSAVSEASRIFADALPVLPIRLAALVTPGRSDPANAPALLAEAAREADRTIALDPKNADGYVARARLVAAPGWSDREKNLALAVAQSGAGPVAQR